MSSLDTIISKRSLRNGTPILQAWEHFKNCKILPWGKTKPGFLPEATALPVSFKGRETGAVHVPPGSLDLYSRCCDIIEMTGPTAKTLANWKEARQKAVNKLTECQGKMARNVLEQQYQNNKALNKLVGELEAKMKTPEKI